MYKVTFHKAVNLEKYLHGVTQSMKEVLSQWTTQPEINIVMRICHWSDQGHLQLFNQLQEEIKRKGWWLKDKLLQSIIWSWLNYIIKFYSYKGKEKNEWLAKRDFSEGTEPFTPSHE